MGPKKPRGGPEGPPLEETATGARRLPAAVARATTVAGDGAGTNRRATETTLGDHEGVVRATAVGLGLGRDGVVAGAGRRNRDLARAGTDVQTGVRRAGALLVVLLAGEAGLDLRHHVARVRLGVRVLTLLLLAEEGRQGDRGKDADDQNDDEELDKGKTALLRLNTLAELPQHNRVLLGGLLHQLRWL